MGWLVLGSLGRIQPVRAQFIDTSADRVKTPLVVNLKRIGTLQPPEYQTD